MNIGTLGNPFSSLGNWYRGSPHNHTIASDGQHSVSELAQWYQDQGMDFIVITDHDIVADVSGVGHFDISVIPGAEVGVCWDGTLGAEVLCLGIDEIKRKNVHPQDVINDALEQGGLPYISHPYVSGVYSGLMMDLDGLVGIEVYNHGGQAVWNRGIASVHLDDLIGMGKIVWGLASDDLHRIREIGPQSWVEVKAQSTSRKDILSAMRDGFYYSTTGPQIHDISFNSTHVSVRCSEAKQITFSSLPWLSRTVHADEAGFLTEARVPLDAIGSAPKIEETLTWLLENQKVTARQELKSVVRVEVLDHAGKIAWSNPIPIPEP